MDSLQIASPGYSCHVPPRPALSSHDPRGTGGRGKWSRDRGLVIFTELDSIGILSWKMLLLFDCDTVIVTIDL